MSVSDNDEAFSAMLGKTVQAVEHDEESVVVIFKDGTRVGIGFARTRGRPVIDACELEPTPEAGQQVTKR